MKPEIEAKFLDVDINDIRSKLADAGAVLVQPMRFFRRAILDNEAMVPLDAFVRVRDEGNKITVTYKQFDAHTVDGTKEIETSVGNFEQMVALLQASGLKQRSLQESKRETWKLDNCEVVIDEWPWVKPYIEIEGGDERSIQAVASTLDLNWDAAVFGDVMHVYRAAYPKLDPGVSIGYMKSVKFGDPVPDSFKD